MVFAVLISSVCLVSAESTNWAHCCLLKWKLWNCEAFNRDYPTKSWCISHEFIYGTEIVFNHKNAFHNSPNLQISAIRVWSSAHIQCKCRDKMHIRTRQRKRISEKWKILALITLFRNCMPFILLSTCNTDIQNNLKMSKFYGMYGIITKIYC